MTIFSYTIYLQYQKKLVIEIQLFSSRQEISSGGAILNKTDLIYRKIKSLKLYYASFSFHHELTTQYRVYIFYAACVYAWTNDVLIN
jgi:hypothetical protein